MAAPTFFAVGGIIAGSPSSLGVSWPSNCIANDVGILVLETGGATAVSNNGGFSHLPGSPVIDPAGGSSLQVLWRRATGAMGGLTLTTFDDHVVGRLAVFRGCVVGPDNPWDSVAFDTKAVASSTATCPTLTTSVRDTLIVLAASRPNDDGSMVHFGVPVNSSLTGLAEIAESGSSGANGGGMVVSYGIKNTHGIVGATTMSKIAATTDVTMSLALRSTTILIAGSNQAQVIA
jgi:hypothetical protein